MTIEQGSIDTALLGAYEIVASKTSISVYGRYRGFTFYDAVQKMIGRR